MQIYIFAFRDFHLIILGLFMIKAGYSVLNFDDTIFSNKKL
jgi:hypothetical protein